VKSARAIVDDVNQGKGTVGKLLREDAIYLELKGMLESFRETGEVARENAPLATLTTFTALFFNVLN